MLGELFQPMHLLLILVIALLLFGPGKLPQIAANMGKSIREFKSALSAQDEIKVPAQQPEAQPAQQPVQQAQTAQQAQPAQPAQQAAAQTEAPKQEQKNA